MRSNTTEEGRVGPRDGKLPASEVASPAWSPTELPITRNLTLAYVSTLVVVALVAIVSALGLVLAPTGLYGVKPTLVSVFVGQDAANLVVGLPILLGSLWLAWRGNLIGLLLWPGALYYVLYTYALYLVGTPFNVLFLPYILLVTLSAYTTIGVVASVDGEAIRHRFAGVSARLVGGALVGVGVLATAGLTAPVIPALASPATIDPLLHARWIVDYTVGNPVLLIGGVLLWRRDRLGYVAAAGLLFLSGANGVVFAVGGVLGALLTATPVEATVIAVHLVIAAVCFALFGVFLRGVMPGESTSSMNGRLVATTSAGRR